MAEITTEQMREAAASLRAQSEELEVEKIALKQQALALVTQRFEINARQNDLNQAAVALEYKAGEQERGGPAGTPSDAVSALIEGALAASGSSPVAAEVVA